MTVMKSVHEISTDELLNALGIPHGEADGVVLTLRDSCLVITLHRARRSEKNRNAEP